MCLCLVICKNLFCGCELPTYCMHCFQIQPKKMFYPTYVSFHQEIAFPKMVASCCRFLCYFCRISRQNQKAMFDHLSYLLENSSVGLGGYLPL